MSDTSPQPRSTAQTVVIGVVVVCLAALAASVVAWNGMLNVARPKVTVSSAVASSVGELKRESKLVVLTLPISITIHKASSKEPLWGIVPQGTAELLMLVPDNRVQYVLNMDGIVPGDFVYDNTARTLIFRAPQPVLDETMVSLQSDPEKIKLLTATGWLRMDSFSGENLRNAARQEVKEHVLNEARKPHYKEVAREIAELHLRKLLEPMMRTVDSNVKLQIEFSAESRLSGGGP